MFDVPRVLFETCPIYPITTYHVVSFSVVVVGGVVVVVVVLVSAMPSMSMLVVNINGSQVICRLTGHVCSLVAARVSEISSDVISMSVDGIIKVQHITTHSRKHTFGENAALTYIPLLSLAWLRTRVLIRVSSLSPSLSGLP